MDSVKRGIRADEVELLDIEYLWRDRIPKGMLTVIAGQPDQGKSMVAAHIASDVSREGGKVLYSSWERNPALVEVPRLKASGAVLRNIEFWRFMMPEQMSELASKIVADDIALVIIDPLSAHLGDGVGRHSDSIRKVTNPLSELIEKTGTAVIIIEHALKRVSPHANPLSAIGGTNSGLPAACAMGFLFGKNPDAPDEQAILACAKHNIRDKPSAIAFEFDESDVEGITRPVVSLMYDEEITFDPIRLVSQPPSEGKIGRPDHKKADAMEWLTNYLFDTKGAQPVPAKVVYEDAKQAGIPQRTLRRAKADLEVVVNPPGGGPKVTWELPDTILDALRDDDDDDDTDAASEPEDGSEDILSDADIAQLLGGGDDE